MNEPRGLDWMAAVLDALPDAVVVLDDQGQAVHGNRHWHALDPLAAAASRVDAVAHDLAALREGRLTQAIHEIERPGPLGPRWFLWQARGLRRDGRHHTVVVQREITPRKTAEAQLQALSRDDLMTGLANHHGFDEFLSAEWRRCQRASRPLSLMLLVLVPDHDGQPDEDEADGGGPSVCDADIHDAADLIASLARRPGDQAARLDERTRFALVMGDTDAGTARQRVNALQRQLDELRRRQAPPRWQLRLALHTAVPAPDQAPATFIAATETLLDHACSDAAEAVVQG